MANPGELLEPSEPGTPVPDLSPEARRRQAAVLQADPTLVPLASRVPRSRPREILSRVAIGTWNDGFIHAGNLAYMAMLAIFPFFILGAGVVTALGDAGDSAATVRAVQSALPRNVGEVIAPVARDVIEARGGGWLLWAGSLVAIWTLSSLIETIRDILRRAYGTQHTVGFLWARLSSTGIIMIAMVLLLLSLLAQVTIGAAEEAIDAWAPQLASLLEAFVLSRGVTALVFFFSIYLLFYALTPAAYRARCYPKWPGALAVTGWWLAVTLVFPPMLRSMFSYSLTYGSLAGIMIALFFFWLIGLGVVVGAELNAALACTPEELGETDKARIDEEETAR
jgi:membrane protein